MSAWNNTRILPASMIAVAASVAGCATGPVPAGAQETAPDAALIHVTGTGVVQVEPDRARLSLAVETESEDARSAAARNGERMEAVLSALRAAGGSGLTLETRGYNLTPVYERNRSNPSDPPRIVGYRVVNQVEAVTDDLDGVGDLIDAGLGAGSNRISGLTFFVSDTRDAQDEAYRLAVTDALRQAGAMAEALGMELGPVEEIRGNVRGEQPRPMGDMMFSAQAEARTPVEPGTTGVTASVTASFRLGG